MEIFAKKREILGKKVRILRKEKILPAVVFGKGKQSTALTLSLADTAKVLKTAGESVLLDLAVEGETALRKVLISEVQRNFVTGKASHISFHEVSLKEKITARIPIEFVGESPVVKSGEGILITLIDEIEVECLPTDLPSHFEVDISKLAEVGDFIPVSALNYDRSKITVAMDMEELLIKVDYAEQLEEEVTTSVEEIEVTGEKPKEEGSEEVEKETEKERGKDKEEVKEKVKSTEKE